MRHLKQILFVAVAAITSLVVAVSCGYKVTYNLSGGSIPPEAKTFSVAYFPNNAPMVAPTLSNVLTLMLCMRNSSMIRQWLPINSPCV